MKIIESYFAELESLSKDIVPISVSLYAPVWFNGLTCKSLAPTPEILHKYKSLKIGVEEYIDMYYRDVLSQYNVQNILWSLANMSGGKDVALICYEKRGTFCHRHLIIMWLEGKSVEEMKKAFLK